MWQRNRIRSFLLFYVFIFGALIIGTAIGSHVVTVISQAAPLQERSCVVIDAGHGGMDGGATSCTGVLESTLNLQIALRLNDLFHLLGYDTSMIRTTDISVHTEGDTIAEKKFSDLKHRVKQINDTENALLISIHQNYFSDSRYSGAQVFYSKNEGSEQLSKLMQQAFITTVNKGSKRQNKMADGIYLLEHIECAGVLVECGFLSHPEEEAKLRTEEYQKKLCCIITATVSKFLDE